MSYSKEQYLWIMLRICLGWIMIWAFVDKLFGFGFATVSEKSWLNGNSPTLGFLKAATAGPFAAFYQSIAGNAMIDWLFMLGLLLIGLALLLGIGMKIAGYSGALMMILLWSAHLPPQQNPLIDEHIIYLIIFIAFTSVKTGQWFGFGKWWAKTALVQRFPLLE